MKNFVSVVIATYNRQELLVNQLKALSKQTVSFDKYEVVIVDDGSTDFTLPMLRAWAEHHPNFRFVTQKNAGPGRARNKGVAMAKGDIIAFTDDDCIVGNDWVENIIATFEKSSCIGIQGLTTTNKAERTPLTHQIENESFRLLTPTCNAAFRKDAFVSVGGFSPHFPAAHNEDTELSWKISKKGLIRFEPRVHVVHPPIKKSFAYQVKRMKMLTSEFTLYKLMPDEYKKFRNSSPWKTIFFEVAVYHQLRSLKSLLRFWRRPAMLLTGLAIQISSFLYLIGLIPTFISESRANKLYLTGKA